MSSQRASWPRAGVHDRTNVGIWLDFRLLLVELKLAQPSERQLVLVTCENLVVCYESEYNIHRSHDFNGNSRVTATMQGFAVQDMYSDQAPEHFLLKLRKGRSNTGADAVEVTVQNTVSFSDMAANNLAVDVDLNTRTSAMWAPDAITKCMD
eukprot:SAG22_NODE_8070_length_686_cov_0.967632_2_plen_151_part_01